MIGGEETHHCAAWSCKVKLPEIIDGEWEVVERDMNLSLTLLHRFQELGMPNIASYQLAMTAKEGMAYLIKERTNSSDCRK